MTSLSLPTDVRYPVKILSLLVPSANAKAATSSHNNFKQSTPDVARTTPLFTYTFDRLVNASTTKGKEKETESVVRIYESPLEGVLIDWLVKEGAVLTQK
jgi:hypothetical protein